VLAPSFERATPEALSPHQAYLIGGERYATRSPGFADAVAQAHAEHQRPRCLCQPDGVDMYIARLAGQNDGFIIKRMPETGSHHAIGCPHYEPPADLSGLGQVLGSAIVEDPSTGQTTLKLDFPLTRRPGRSTQPPAGDQHDSVKSGGSRLSLRGLLHYLWDQAELTRWHPGFAGKRSWSTVRRHLLAAADNKIARGHPLRARLYIPEAFSVEQREALNARRLAHWSRVLPRPGQPVERLILIGEIKDIVPARFGSKAIVKHLPDQAFALDDTLYRRLGRRFESQLSLWRSNETLRQVTIATFILSRVGVPSIDEVSLMPVTSQWLAVDDAFDFQLTERLVSEGRAFIKPLRYNLPTTQRLPTALLTDTGDATTTLAIDRPERRDVHDGLGAAEGMSVNGSSTWCWRPDEQAMPALPPKQLRWH
jgi:hypothetical protein